MRDTYRSWPHGSVVVRARWSVGFAAALWMVAPLGHAEPESASATAAEKAPGKTNKESDAQVLAPGQGKAPGEQKKTLAGAPKMSDEAKAKLEEERAQARQARAKAQEEFDKARTSLKQVGEQVEKAGEANREKLVKARADALATFMTAKAELDKTEGPAPKFSAKKKKTIRVKMAKVESKLDKNRERRVDAHQKKLEKLYGKSLEDEKVREELGLHAWRMARLERILDLGQAAGRRKSVSRARSLIREEKERHGRKMTDLTGVALPEKTNAEAPVAGQAVPAAAKPAPKVPAPAKQTTEGAQ